MVVHAYQLFRHTVDLIHRANDPFKSHLSNPSIHPFCKRDWEPKISRSLHRPLLLIAAHTPPRTIFSLTTDSASSGGLCCYLRYLSYLSHLLNHTMWGLISNKRSHYLPPLLQRSSLCEMWSKTEGVPRSLLNSSPDQSLSQTQ